MIIKAARPPISDDAGEVNKNMADKNRNATLTFGDRALELPLMSPTCGPDVIDIRKLYGQGDVFTFDPGFTSTASCLSDITFIDGNKGELLYRGYPIDQLAERSHFLEVCFLLLYGDLPSAGDLEDFEARVTNHTMVHEQMHNFFRGFRRDAHPMATMVGVVGAMSAFYHDSTDINDPLQREIASVRLIAKNADDCGDGLQIFDWPAPSSIRTTIWIMRQTSCACAMLSRPRTTR